MRFRIWLRRVLPLLALVIVLSGATRLALADDLVRQGAALLAQGRAADAFALLLAQEPQRAGDLEFDVLMGQAAHASGQYTRAIMARERVLLAQPDNVAAQVALGLSLYAAGDRPGAQALPPGALALLVPVEAGGTLDPFLSTYDRSGRDGLSSLKGYLELGVGRDSNANGGPAQGGPRTALPGAPAWDLLPEALAQSGSFAGVTAGLRGRAVLDSQWSVVGNVVAGMRQYRGDLDRWNPAWLDASVGLAWRIQQHEWIASAQGSHYALDGSGLRTASGVLGEWIYRLDGFRQWGSFVQVLDVRYPDQALRDVRRTVVGTAYSHVFRGGAIAYAGFYGGREQPGTDGADPLGHRLAGVRLGGQWPLAAQWALFGSADWEHRRYGGEDPFFAVRRTDRQAQWALGVSWNPAPGWRVAPQWSWLRNASTLPITTYQRRVFHLTVRKEF